MNNICLIYAILVSIIGGSLSISSIVTDPQNKYLLNTLEVIINNNLNPKNHFQYFFKVFFYNTILDCNNLDIFLLI